MGWNKFWFVPKPEMRNRLADEFKIEFEMNIGKDSIMETATHLRYSSEKIK